MLFRSLRRFILGSTFAVTSFALIVHQQTAPAQAPKAGESAQKDSFFLESPLWPGDLRTKVFAWKNGEVSLENERAKAAKDLELLAKIIIYKVTDRKYFTPSIEQKFGVGKNEQSVLANPETDQTMDGVMTEINRYVLVPKQSEKSPYFQIEYIKEFGKATDLAIRDVLKRAGNEPRTAIVRINAGRALASVCRSGASAHVPLLVDLIKSETTPPELQFWAMKAAENLIGASDLIKATEGRPEFHALKDPEISLLVNTLEAAIKRFNTIALPPKAAGDNPPAAPPAPPPPPAGNNPPPPPPAGAPPGGRIEATIAPPYDADVAMYLRKQAVRAISKCRKVHFSDANKTLSRPGVILARFAVSDPSISPVAQPHECADAAMGLAQMIPDNKVNIDVQLDALAASVASFGAWKVTGFEMKEAKVVQWKRTAVAIAGALAVFKTLPDKSPAANGFRQKIISLADLCLREVIEPIRGEVEGIAATAARPDALIAWRAEPANKRQSDLMLRDDRESQVVLPRTR